MIQDNAVVGAPLTLYKDTKANIEALSLTEGDTFWATDLDIEGYYEGKEEEIQTRFTEPLIMLDPVDKARNVASAVRPNTFHTFVGATRAFLKAPSKIYFYPPPANPYSTELLRKRLKSDSRACIFLTCPTIEAVPDVLWGQLYKTQRALRRILQFNDFKVLRDGVWSDEKTLIVFILELEQCILPATKKHKGPPLTRRLECEDFLSKYAIGNNAVVTGPYIEDGRWFVHLRRQVGDASELLRNTLKKGAKDTGIAELVSQALKVGFKVSTNNEISKIYSNNKAFAKFLTAFLKGKPFWLEPHNSKAGKVGT